MRSQDLQRLLPRQSYSFARLIYATGVPLARLILSMVHVPARLNIDSYQMFRNLGLLVLLILVSNVLTGYLRAKGQFRRIAVSTSAANLVFLLALLLLSPGLTVWRVFMFAVLQLFV